MPLSLDAVGKDDKSILDNMIQLYMHEMCKYQPIEMGEDGRFKYDHLDAYWHEAGRFPFFIRCKGRLAGFVLVRQIETLAKEPTFSVAEFFLVENYRRLGIGEEIARMVFEKFQGHWQIGVMSSNQSGRDFWRQVLYRYTANNYRTTHVDGWEGPVYVFKSPGPRPKEPAAETASDLNPEFFGQTERS